MAISFLSIRGEPSIPLLQRRGGIGSQLLWSRASSWERRRPAGKSGPAGRRRSQTCCRLLRMLQAGLLRKALQLRADGAQQDIDDGVGGEPLGLALEVEQ